MKVLGADFDGVLGCDYFSAYHKYMRLNSNVLVQGSRSEAGRQWWERIWTTIATCTQHGKSVFDFLVQSVNAYFNGESGSSLAIDSG